MALDNIIDAFENLLNNITADADTAENVRDTVMSSTGIQSKRSFSLSDYVWYPWYTYAKNDDIYQKLRELQRAATSNIPKLNVWEFQPTLTISMYIRLLKEAISAFKEKASGAGGTAELMQTLGTIIGGVSNIINPTDPGAISNNFEVGNKFYRDLIADGKYVKSFQFPYYSDELWNASSGKGWKGLGIAERLLGPFAGIAEKIGVGAPAKPEFSLSAAGNPQISAKFYLFNGHIDAVRRNLQLIYNLLPGGYWIQDAYLQRGSNLYTIAVENMFQYQLCSMEATVNMKGKIRKSPNTGFDKVSVVPDIYEVSLTYTSLFPTSLNEFLAPYFSSLSAADSINVNPPVPVEPEPVSEPQINPGGPGQTPILQ